MSMLGVSLLREIVNKEFITNPGDILQRLREEVIRSLNQTGKTDEQKDGLDIAIVSINTESRHCKYAAFKQLLLDHSGDSMDQQNSALLNNILKWQGNYEQIDDMVVIGVKV